jgi:hypothetical protein
MSPAVLYHRNLIDGFIASSQSRRFVITYLSFYSRCSCPRKSSCERSRIESRFARDQIASICVRTNTLLNGLLVGLPGPAATLMIKATRWLKSTCGSSNGTGEGLAE